MFPETAKHAALKSAEVNHLEQQQAKGQSVRPAFAPDGHAMLMCRVALGKVAKGKSSLRQPPSGFYSVCRSLDERHNDIYAVFDNSQSYPEWIVHYK